MAWPANLGIGKRLENRSLVLSGSFAVRDSLELHVHCTHELDTCPSPFFFSFSVYLIFLYISFPGRAFNPWRKIFRSMHLHGSCCCCCCIFSPLLPGRQSVQSIAFLFFFPSPFIRFPLPGRVPPPHHPSSLASDGPNFISTVTAIFSPFFLEKLKIFLFFLRRCFNWPKRGRTKTSETKWKSIKSDD